MTLGIRPENVRLANAEAGARYGEVSLLERLGSEALVHVSLGSPQSETLVAKLGGDVSLSPRQNVSLHLDPSACHLFDGAGEAIRGSRA